MKTVFVFTTVFALLSCNSISKTKITEEPQMKNSVKIIGDWKNVKNDISDQTLVMLFEKIGKENTRENILEARNDFDRELGKYYTYDGNKMTVYNDFKNYCSKSKSMENNYQINDTTIQIKQQKNNYHFRGDTLALRFGGQGLYFYSLNVKAFKNSCN